MQNRATSNIIAGIDIGGTNVRIALADIDDPHSFLLRHSIDTPVGAGPDRLLQRIADEVRGCLQKADIDYSALAVVGCATPGVVHHATGTVHVAANLDDWTDVRLTNLLERQLGVPVCLENDVNAAALAEYQYGAGVGCHSLAYLTISTGVAAGLVLDGNLLRGFHYAAGEVGFMIPGRDHIASARGQYACLEQMAAGVGISRAWAHSEGGSASAAEVFQAADDGHSEALAIVARAADYLAMAAVAIGAVVDPEVLVLGGSIARHQVRVTDRIREVTHAALPFPPRVVDEQFGGDGPLIGALTLAARLVGAAPAGALPSAV